jgi:type III secretion system (T3SS) inner membrane Yop/YscD-like protein
VGPVIWVEILSRHHDVAARHRCAGPVIRIGRGYDNDVVIDDPYVAPRHLIVRRREDGALVAEDAGSANGMLAEPGGEKHQRLVVDGARVIRIGRTRLRIRDTLHAVAPERVLRAPERLWPAVLALTGTVLALQALTMWLGETVEPKLSRYAMTLLGLPLFILGWTSVWAILSRIFAGHAQFARHLFIALCGLLAVYLYDALIEYGAFAFSWASLAVYRYVGMWLIVAALCLFHLRAINPARLQLKGGVVAALAATAIAMQTLSQSEARSGYDGQSYVRLLKPPAFRFASPRNENAFFDGVERLKGRLDRARKEESPDVYSDSDDD